MKLLVATALVLSASIARADGFVCETESGLVVKAYNQTEPTKGTRNAAVLVISDSGIAHGRKTVASFTDAKGTLTNSSSSYEAKIDLRVAESNRKGELIAGTKLGFIDRITLSVDFSYAKPVRAGTALEGELVVLKRNGDVISEDAVCKRYLKN